jgi:periplasmic protein TonB
MQSEITNPTWEDVVFEFRNKAYGAYALRKLYNENVARACLFALLITFLVIGSANLASLLHVTIKVAVPKPSDWGLTAPPTITQKNPAKRREVNSEKHANPDLLKKVVKEDVEDKPCTKPIETTAAVVEDGVGPESPNVESRPGFAREAAPVIAERPAIVDFAEVMPEYQGGVNAMMKFLRNNLHYPASAKRMGVEGTVYVRFVVNSQGQVVDVEVARGCSAVLDQEALRVIAMMSKWKPGLQHNMPVNVRMVLPIKFQLEE